MTKTFPIYFKQSEIVGLQDSLVCMLDIARKSAGIPFIITSGLRTASQNEAVGGVSDSAHLKGMAVDLKCSNGNERFLMIPALLVAGFTRIEIAPFHIHVDIDKTKPQRTIFLKN